MERTEIRDFFLATYLLAEGYILDEIAGDPSGARDAERFYFRTALGLADRIAAYEADTARISPKAFANAIVTLRRRQAEARGR